MKRVLVRPLATADIDAAIDHYLSEKSLSAAQGFADAVEDSFSLLASHSALGSERYAGLLPGLAVRMWPLTNYPFLVFYLEHAAAVEIIRVLHTRRDIPAALSDDAAV